MLVQFYILVGRVVYTLCEGLDVINPLMRLGPNNN